MKSTQSEFSIRTAFQSYRWPSAGELWFQSQRCQTVLKAQGIGSTQPGSNSGGHVLNGIPTADTQGRSTSAPSSSPTPSSDPPPASASQLQAELEEELVLKVGLPILPTLLCVGYVSTASDTLPIHTPGFQAHYPESQAPASPLWPTSLPAGHSLHATSPSGMATLSSQQ